MHFLKGKCLFNGINISCYIILKVVNFVFKKNQKHFFKGIVATILFFFILLKVYIYIYISMRFASSLNSYKQNHSEKCLCYIKFSKSPFEGLFKPFVFHLIKSYILQDTQDDGLKVLQQIRLVRRVQLLVKVTDLLLTERSRINTVRNVITLSVTQSIRTELVA